jgi:hypothetical protein
VSRGLDHIVHAVRDLDAAAAFYRRLGFAVGARNRHPRAWGTQNHIVQLPGTFIELLAIADPTGIVPHETRHFSFGAFNRDFLARGEGLSMLALEGRGQPDADDFRAAGIGHFDLYEFEREGRRPDGTPLKVSFALAFAADPKAPDTGFFTCQHRHPENFWNPAFQVHANTASGVVGVVLVAENPSDHHIFLSAFAGEREMLATSAGISLTARRGTIDVLTPHAFREHYGTPPPDTSNGARLAAVRFTAANRGAVGLLLKQAAIAAAERMGRLVVGPDAALGATLVFEGN